MRRTDKEIKERESIDRIIAACQVLRLGLANKDEAYIVPVSFGYDGSAFYFHTALVGRKIAFFEANPTVCFELEDGVTLVNQGSDPCEWTFSYQCVIGSGRLQEMTGFEGKHEGLLKVMQQYSQQDWSFTAASLEKVRVWKLEIESISGKQSKDRILS
ncbi:MFS transporter [Geomonas limicola]|uniref:MFS transporter n=1 Tax=Geomonas limicola TaxID=2740186 RepID=A0A6V8N5B4_9BACT|nr:pyridoxamine 5'-phosphate oxidase family protein [Geomonas limicola]GFO67134.1 MFS transporter [Geomonas limicola]